MSGSCSPAGAPIRSRRRGARQARQVRARSWSSPGSGPPKRFPALLDAADILVSPRSTGTNTPLKIYQYLRSGRAIVATRLLTHTQVLDDEVSFLTPATAEGFAQGILDALADPAHARAVGQRARELAEVKYSYESYLARTRDVCAYLGAGAADAGRRRRGVSTPHRDHYSYSMYADPAMAERFEGARFSGPIGRMIAESQERVIARFLSPLPGRTVLDVGTGTGRAAVALSLRGAVVTGVDASNEMLAVARRNAADRQAQVTFVQGDAHGLAFDDRSFDAVVCLRVLMHTPDWRQSLGELCRIADGRVVFDYPALSSAAALQAVTRHLAAAAGSRVEAYRVFSDRAVRAVLSTHGFRVVDAHREFVLPIAFHKRIGSAALTAGVERALARVGLRSMLGSPVTIVAERCAS